MSDPNPYRAPQPAEDSVPPPPEVRRRGLNLLLILGPLIAAVGLLIVTLGTASYMRSTLDDVTSRRAASPREISGIVEDALYWPKIGLPVMLFGAILTVGGLVLRWRRNRRERREREERWRRELEERSPDAGAEGY